MVKVIIDTNVIVSSLIQISYPYKIVFNLFINNKFELCISEDVFKEYCEVLSRPKFSRFIDFKEKAYNILSEIESRSSKYTPTEKIQIINDISDNMFLELANESSADYIITGNLLDFNFYKYKQTKIVSPKEFWENFTI